MVIGDLPILSVPGVLRAIQTHHKWTRKELAAALGVSTDQLDQWLYGFKSPMWDTIVPKLERVGVLSFKVFEPHGKM